MDPAPLPSSADSSTITPALQLRAQADACRTGTTTQPKDFQKAIDLYTQSGFQHDDGTSLYFLGLMYQYNMVPGEENGKGKLALKTTNAELMKKAVEMFVLAAEKNVSLACYQMGCLYRDGLEMFEDEPLNEKYRDTNEARNVIAATSSVAPRLTAEHAEMESGAKPMVLVAKDMKKAVKMFEIAKDLGDFEAQYEIGYYYELGLHGYWKSHKKAMELYEKAMKEDHAPSMVRYAVLLRDSLSAKVWSPQSERLQEQNQERIFAILQTAAQQKNKAAIAELGYMYENGYGTPMSTAVAAKLYKSVTRCGIPMADYQLGMIYMNGTAGTSPIQMNMELAKECFDYASSQGYALADFQLGRLYARGVVKVDAGLEAARGFCSGMEIVPQDYRKALFYFQQGYERGDYVCGIYYYWLRFKLGPEYNPHFARDLTVFIIFILFALFFLLYNIAILITQEIHPVAIITKLFGATSIKTEL
eukprot:CAMPEP_0184699274 /NCGR_PEP_ID=MMETSP0313-20130426/5603_1 /TAXON_ID=2792 /ORGANISM="Porphyridium aerugineum, Strain SAG 1380-2" /LENGTH=474 /DNA_ID=CAMNT_0027158339 /DNA_START=105 /DNA_END=1529 /DNA_ORIENTATION=-